MSADGRENGEGEQGKEHNVENIDAAFWRKKSFILFPTIYLSVMEVKYVHLRTLHALGESGTLHFVYLPLDRAKSNQMSHFRFSHL